MAPLKRGWNPPAGDRTNPSYPWLKCHGSIEAASGRPGRRGKPTYPWLKCHGSIEAALGTRRPTAGHHYPWLKCHGSIEARAGHVSSVGIQRLSMAKMPWLH